MKKNLEPQQPPAEDYFDPIVSGYSHDIKAEQERVRRFALIKKRKEERGLGHHDLKKGNFISGFDEYGRLRFSETVHAVEGMPGYVLRVDFPEYDDKNSGVLNRAVQRLESLDRSAQRHFLIERIKERRQVFQELKKKYGIAVPPFKSIIRDQGNRLGSFTLVKKVDGKTAMLEELTDEMLRHIEDTYLGLARYFLDKAKSLDSWNACLSDVKAHQFVYGSIGDESKLYYVDVGMESIFFREDVEHDSDHYVKANKAYYQVYDLLESAEAIERKMGREIYRDLKRKLIEIRDEIGGIMMQYSTPIGEV